MIQKMREVKGKERDNVIELAIDFTKTKTISVKLDAETIDEIERLRKRFNYSNRSEFIRDAIRFYIKVLSNLNEKDEIEEIIEKL
ncbi:MAG: ribbon-helix-helix protein, CopG family [Ignisphaera sp.]|nr:ribbon-helix-helix protein, CopG family [Ignisphaera sp.]